jgi:glycosyltransferase involved in cell wall biosynthesis
LFWTDTLQIKQKLAALRPDVVHAWGTERGAGLVASRLDCPSLVTIQGLLSWYMTVTPMHWSFRFLRLLEDVSLRRATVATTESTFAAAWLRARFPTLSVRQIEHAPNWQFHSLERRPQARPARLIFVGSFDIRKGADLLMLALDRLRTEFDFELVVVGFAPPELKASLDGRVSPETWRRTRFLQGLTSKEVARELSQATLMVFPTRADTSPNAVKEAVVAGLPVVGSRVGGIPDYVFPDKNGVLFDSENLDQLTAAIRVALRHPLFGVGRVDPQTLEQTRAYLSPKQMARQFWGLYQELAAKPLTL